MRRTPAALFAAIGLALGVAAGCSSSGEVATENTAPAEGTADDTTAAGDVGPRPNEDHWHAAFDVYACDSFLGPFSDASPDIGGLHTHQDGLVHIHPWTEEYSGVNATLGLFAEQIGIGLGNGTMAIPPAWDEADLDRPPDTTAGLALVEWSDGNSCSTGPGRVALFVWPPDAADDTEPEVITSDIAGTRFSADGQRFVLAFVPEGVVPPQPPSTPELAAPSDMG